MKKMNLMHKTIMKKYVIVIINAQFAFCVILFFQSLYLKFLGLFHKI